MTLLNRFQKREAGINTVCLPLDAERRIALADINFHIEPGQLARNARPDRRDQKEGMVYDLVAIGRPDDRSLTLLVLTAPVAIQTGEMAAPVAMTGDESLAGAVEPEALTDGTPTPTS